MKAHSLLHVINSVSRVSGVSTKDIKGKSRKRNIVFARQLFMYISYEIVNKENYTYTLLDVSKYVNRKYSTAIHSVSKIKDENFLSKEEIDTYNKVINDLYSDEYVVKRYRNMIQLKRKKILDLEKEIEDIKKDIEKVL